MTSEALYFRERTVQGIIVLTPRHPLKGAGESALSERLDRLVQDGCRHFLIDLAELPCPDCRDIGRLIRALHSVRDAGCRIRLCNIPKEVLDVLKTSRLDSLLDLYLTGAEAMARLAQGGFEIRNSRFPVPVLNRPHS